MGWPDPLFALLALFAAARLGRGLLWLVAAVVVLVVGQSLGNLFRGQLASAQMQNIVCDCRIGFGWFHGFLLVQGIVSFNTAGQYVLYCSLVSVVSQKLIEEQLQILRLTTPKL
jgi:hypothetical protein